MPVLLNWCRTDVHSMIKTTKTMERIYRWRHRSKVKVPKSSLFKYSEWNHFQTSFSMLDYYSSFIIAMFEYLILLLIDNSNIAKWLLIFRHSSSKITMLFKWVIMLVLELSECSNLRQYGEIRIANNLKETIRVIMSPAISWNYHARRTNVTLQRNPFKAVGGTHIL